MGAGSALHLCTRGSHTAPSWPACGMWTARQGEQGGKKKKKKDLAGGQSSRSSYRCCYLHYFHIRKNKEQEAANNSEELSVCPARSLSQSAGWSRQGTTSWTQSISVLMRAPPAACASKLEEEGRQDPHLSLLPNLRWGPALRAPPPAFCNNQLVKRDRGLGPRRPGKAVPGGTAANYPAVLG